MPPSPPPRIVVEVWAAMSDEQRCTTDYLCGNHSRNLPVAAFNRLFDEWLAEVLGDAFLLEWAAPSNSF